MSPVGKAVWFMESHFARAITLGEIADASGVSRFNLSRAFGTATGLTVMGYLRRRRLTEAARALSAGAPDILTVALDAAYGSHEAFSRAFRDLFGLTPEQVRLQRHLDNLELLEPYQMDESLLIDLDAPRVEAGRPLRIAGLSGRYTFATNQGIPAQWQRFAPHFGNVPGQIGWTSYGVCRSVDEAGGFDYISGVEVAENADIGPELMSLRIPAQRYLVFVHRGHIAAIRKTIYTIWNRSLPESGHKATDGPEFELYDQRFDATTGVGEVEIWIPVQD